MSHIHQRLSELGISLPPPREPAFSYVPTAIFGDFCFLNGQLPWTEGSGLITGTLGKDCSIDLGRDAARLCILNGLSVLKRDLNDLTRISRVIKMTGFVACVDGFHHQPKVIDAASNLLVDIFGEAGQHARSAVGVCQLPRGVPVEIELILGLQSRG